MKHAKHHTAHIAKHAAHAAKHEVHGKRGSKHAAGKTASDAGDKLDSYSITADGIPITITIRRIKGEFVPHYEAELTNISQNTQLILEKVRQALIRDINIGVADITDPKRETAAEERYSDAARKMIEKSFPDASEQMVTILTAFLLQKSLGLGNLEIVRNDPSLEEIAINGSSEPVWVYHRKYGWLKTNITLENENLIKHYAAMIGRRVGRQITVLEPMMDANLATGERFNATLMPISNFGNTITLRKFATKPWTITDFITTGTMSAEAAALIWEGIQYELSMIIVGGTASGKTSLLNVISNFFPPNQRIISIEDTRELKLPTFLHWIPMTTRFPNNEGKGGVTMLNLLVNSLRMRPDRILVGEIRRKEEAEVLFEAIHTGHSVYATLHANDAEEAVTRLTNPPINIPKHMLPAVSMLLVQHRNRRTGLRRVFQLAEILPDATPNILMQWDVRTDKLKTHSQSRAYIKTLQLFTGIGHAELKRHLKEKARVLKWMADKKINTVDEVGKIVAEYYLNHDSLMKSLK
jgi:flagellar protein FlaI